MDGRGGANPTLPKYFGAEPPAGDVRTYHVDDLRECQSERDVERLAGVQ